MNDTILVTGGAGFIGSHLVDALLAQGYRVRVFDNLEPQVHAGLRESGQWPSYCNSEAEFILGDVRDADALRKAMVDVDFIFHQAAMVGVGQSMYQVERYVDVNLRGTAVLLDILANESAIRDRVRKLVVASSMSIYGEGKYNCPVHGPVYPTVRTKEQLAAHHWELQCPVQDSAVETVADDAPLVAMTSCGRPVEPLRTPETKPLHAISAYSITKQGQEELCLALGHAYGIPAVALRYFNAYGARQALSNPYTGVAAIFSGRLLNGKPPVIFEDGLQSRDFVHVSDIVQANLLAMSVPEMDGRAYNVGTGQPTTILDVAESLIEHLKTPVDPEITAQSRAGDIRHCVASIDEIAIHGYRPQVQFADGIAELVNWVRTETASDSFGRVRSELARRGLVAN